MQVRTSANCDIWHLGEEESWQFDMASGQLGLTFQEGQQVTMPAQVVGTYNPKSKTFLWGWANPSVPAALQAAALKVKAYGEEHGVLSLTQGETAASEDLTWEFLALAVRLENAQGAYRPEIGKGRRLCLCFGEVSFARQDA